MKIIPVFLIIESWGFLFLYSFGLVCAIIVIVKNIEKL